MTTWDTICRVCSSPAQYEIFAKIPTDLHETSNEFINWQKPINVILEETTGLKISQDDGLPSTICALCISYMKHASSFRDQVIKNTLSLQVIKHLFQGQPARSAQDKDSLLVTEQQLDTSEQRNVDPNILTDTMQHNGHQKVSKELFQCGTVIPSQEYIMQQMRYLNLLFDKDLNSGIDEVIRQSSALNEIVTNNRQQNVDLEDYETETTSTEEKDDEGLANAAMTKGHIFSYSEKNFEEDDVMNLDELRDAINITVPETFKERKCRACFKRFMLQSSYDEHLEKCIEFKLLVFIEETNLLLSIRRKKAVSPHEFIRRMIFSLRKVCEFLKMNCDEVLLLPEQSSNKNSVPDNTKNNTNVLSTTAATESVLQEEIIESNSLRNEGKNALFADYTTPRHNYISDSYSLTQRLLACESPTPKVSATPISIHNNILYEIERSQSRNANKLKTTNMESENNVRVMRPIPMHANLQSQLNPPTSYLNKTPTVSSVEDRITFLHKLERAVCQNTQDTTISHTSHSTPSISVRKDLMANTNIIPATPSSFSACCNPCNLIFDTLNAFEIHNAVYHNNAMELEAQREEERNRIIAMFENEDDI